MQANQLISIFATKMTLKSTEKMLKSGIIFLIVLIQTSASSQECSIGDYALQDGSTFRSAVRTCAMSPFGNQLLTPNNKEEMDFITRHANNFETDMWVGIHKLLDGEFVTLLGENFIENEFLRWDEGQPNNFPGFNCVVGNRNGFLSTATCTRPSVRSFCKNMNFDRNWFTLKTAANFEDAVLNCALEGAQLVSPTTKSEYDHLAGFVKIAGDGYWLGIHDIFNEGAFINIDGNSIDAFDFLTWEDGRPDIDSSRNCVELRPDGTISDVSCSNSLKYICNK